MPARPDLHPSYDAVVVGARCAGAATSMLLARRGLRVLAVERSRYGSDTLSTHALMRPGVLQLARFGLLDAVRNSGAPPVRSTSFHYADGDVVEVAIKPRDGVDALYAPRRTVLDALLVDAARDAGATVLHETRLVDLGQSPEGRVREVRIEDASGRLMRVEAGIVIGADGVKSTVARLVGAPVERAAAHAAACVYAYFEGLPVPGYQWYFGADASAGAIPTSAGQTCAFVALRPERYRRQFRKDIAASYARVLREAAPDLGARAERAVRVSGFRCFEGKAGYLRKAYGAGWALVGDAGYFKDPITAHGLSDGLRDAELLARAVASGSLDALAEYQATRDALSIRLFDATDAIASFDHEPAELKPLHQVISQEMKRETATLSALEAEGSRAA